MLTGYWRTSIRLRMAEGGWAVEVKEDRSRVRDGGGDERKIFVVKD